MIIRLYGNDFNIKENELVKERIEYKKDILKRVRTLTRLNPGEIIHSVKTLDQEISTIYDAMMNHKYKFSGKNIYSNDMKFYSHPGEYRGDKDSYIEKYTKYVEEICNRYIIDASVGGNNG